MKTTCNEKTYTLNDGIPLMGVDLDILFMGADGEDSDGSFVPAYDICRGGRTAWIKVTPAELRNRISEIAKWDDFEDFVSRTYEVALSKQAFAEAAEFFVDVYEESGSTEVRVA